ncbi:MAG: sigma factor-like helix-turn-helix DNA-binding protein [Kofleriaceae bacterium]
MDSADFTEEEVTTELVRTPPPTSRKVRRERRKRPRSKTIAMKRLTVAEREIFAVMYPVADTAGEHRPQTRAECSGHTGPCPWVACKHHLYLDINPLTGSIKINFPDLEPWELEHTCALDVAEAGALTLEQVGEITNLTRERIRQVESHGLAKLAAQTRRYGLG